MLPLHHAPMLAQRTIGIILRGALFVNIVWEICSDHADDYMPCHRDVVRQFAGDDDVASIAREQAFFRADAQRVCSARRVSFTHFAVRAHNQETQRNTDRAATRTGAYLRVKCLFRTRVFCCAGARTFLPRLPFGDGCFFTRTFVLHSNITPIGRDPFVWRDAGGAVLLLLCRYSNKKY